MSPSGIFEDCRRRIERAGRHRYELTQAWLSSFEYDPYATVIDVQDDGRCELKIKLRENLPTAPWICSIHLGEMLYNLRAALDSCIYAAAVHKSGRNPPPDYNKLAFLLCDSPEKFTDNRNRIDGISTENKKIVEAVQPYRAKDPSFDPNGTSAQFIFGILEEWAKIDRHRRMHIMSTAVSNVRPALNIPEEWILDMETFNCVISYDYCTIAKFRLIPSVIKSGRNVQADPRYTVQIATDEFPPPRCPDDTLESRLELMCFHAIRTINYIEDNCRV